MSKTRKRERTPFQLELRDAERAALEAMAEREQRSMAAQLRLLILRAAESDARAVA
jgi:hypothetical protein